MATGRPSSTGVRGIVKLKNGRFRAQTNIDRVQTHIGVYDTIEEAKVELDKALAEERQYIVGKPYMANDEIITRYKWARNKGEMLTILADLNACSRQTILKIVEAKND